MGFAVDVKQLGMRAWRGEEAPLEALEHIALGVGEPAFDKERGQAGEQVKEAAITIVAATRSKAEREVQAQEAFDDAMFHIEDNHSLNQGRDVCGAIGQVKTQFAKQCYGHGTSRDIIRVLLASLSRRFCGPPVALGLEA